MSLRLRLVLAMTLAALVPLAVVAGLLLAQAERRAAADAVVRLELAKRQTALLVGREQRATRDRVARAAADLSSERGAAPALEEGPASAARALARRLAERHALDLLEIRAADGSLLATSASGAAPPLGIDPAALDDGGIVLAALPITPLPPPPPDEAPAADDPATPAPGRAPAPADDAPPGDDAAPAAPGFDAPGTRRPGELGLVSRATATLRRSTFVVLGAVATGTPFLEEVSAFTGGPAAIVGRDGVAAVQTGEPRGAVITADVPIDPAGWSVRVAAPAADAARVRRDLLGAFGGVAPIAVLSALAIGALLAAGIARPVRALAERAEAMAAEAARLPDRRTPPFSSARDPDDVRSLTRAFDRMLDGLAESERQRLAAERVAAWQEIARRVAHEVRNALSPIGLAVENLRRTRARAPGDLDRALEVETATILEEVASLSRLVDEFSRFARLPAPVRAACDLRALVEQSLAVLAPRLVEAHVEVAIADGGIPHRVVADADQIGRALKNIVANAVDALAREGGPGGGGAGPGAAAGPGGPRRIAITLAASAAHQEIVVRDSGPGFTPEALRRVFEPYFTTRGERGGTGLGMAIVYRIVTEHGGRVSARNAAGGGAEIIVRLPRDVPGADGRE
jgi:signal transduction histidine kinase